MMERNFYSDDDFEQLIKEKTEQYKMYPSEKVWKGVHSSLHTKKRWFIGGMSLLITGIILYAGRELLAPERHGNTVRKAPLAANAPAAGKAPAENTNLPAAFSEYRGGSRSSSSGGSRNSQFSSRTGASFTQSPSLVALAETADSLSSPTLIASKDIPLLEEGHSPVLNGTPGSVPVNAGMSAGHESTNTQTIANLHESGASEDNATASGSQSGNTKEENTIGTRGQQGRTNPAKRNGHAGPTELAETHPGAGADIPSDILKTMTAASGGSTGNLSEMTTDRQRINWLQDWAVYNLHPSPKKGRKALQFFLSPTINYRNLSGGDYLTAKSNNAQNVPYSLVHSGDAKDYVNHIPAIGLEAGGNFLYRATRNLTLKAGVQFNYSRYTIKAYSADSVQQATISLGTNNNGISSSSITNYTTYRTFGGNKQVSLNNEYFQLSLPVGFELRVLGNERLQLNIAAGIQPTWLLNRNAYLLTTDYTGYTQAPSLFRRLNFNGEAEIFLSYKMGGIRWQIGPEFRYQFLSSYTNQYSIRENLKGYGLKIGITKAIR